MIFPWTKQTPKARGRRPPAKRRPAPRQRRDPREFVEGLEQRHLDVIGLALVAVGRLPGASSSTSAGTAAGSAAGSPTGSAQAFGKVAYVVPLALGGWGASLIARPVIQTPSALNAGAVLVLAALLLAFAAADRRPRPGAPAPPRLLRADVHGRVTVACSARASTGRRRRLFQRLGAHILAVLMLVSGVLLLTGTTVAAVLGATGRAVRKAGTQGREVARTVRTQRLGAAAGAEPWGDAPDDEIAITRANETETFETEQLAAEPDDEARSTSATTARAGTPTRTTTSSPPSPTRLRSRPVSPARSAWSRRRASASRRRARRGPGAASPSPRRSTTSSPPTKVLERGKARPGPGHARPRGDGATRCSRRSATSGSRRAARHRQRPARQPLRAAARARAPRSRKVAQLKDDLAYALASTDIRILAPIPGKKAVGVEVPEPAPPPGPPRRHLRGPARRAPRRCVAWLGKDVSGQSCRRDLAKMPHVLVAGTTGSGKSGCVNAILTLDPPARLAERGAAGARRPEAGRAQPLRARPAPADAGGHQPAAGRQRARQPDRRDGEPLRGHGRGPRPQPGRAQPGPRARPARRRCRTSSA